MRELTFGFLNLNGINGANPTAWDVLQSAGAAGFRSAGLRITGRRVEDECVPVVGNASAIRELRGSADGKGIRISSVAGYSLFPDTKVDDQLRLFDTIAELGSNLCLMNIYIDDMSALAALLAQLSEHAATRNIRMGLEFMPFSGLKTISATTEVLEASGADNAGYVMDALHIVRSGSTIEDVRGVDPARIYLAQICDAPSIMTERSIDELIDEARNHRAYPGEGEIDLFGFVDALPANMELEIEAPRRAAASISFESRASESRRVLDKFVADYEAARVTA